MSTVSSLTYDIGTRIGDPSNTKLEAWQILRYINIVIEDIVKKTDCLWAVDEVSGQKRIEVLDYTNLGTAVISLKTSNDDAATDYTEASEWNAATSNSVTATNIATALDAHASVAAYADGAYVYVCCVGGYTLSTLTCDADTDYLTISDAGYETFELSNILSNFRKVRNIYDTDNELMYRPYARQDYNRALVDGTNYTGWGYYVDPAYKLYIKANGANLDSADTFKIDYLYWHTALDSADDSPPAILDHYDEVIIQRVLYYYYMSQAMPDMARLSDITYRELIRDLQYEIRSQGELQEIYSFYRTIR